MSIISRQYGKANWPGWALLATLWLASNAMASTPLYLSPTGLSSIAPTVGELPTSVDDGASLSWTLTNPLTSA